MSKHDFSGEFDARRKAVSRAMADRGWTVILFHPVSIPSSTSSNAKSYQELMPDRPGFGPMTIAWRARGERNELQDDAGRPDQRLSGAARTGTRFRASSGWPTSLGCAVRCDGGTKPTTCTRITICPPA